MKENPKTSEKLVQIRKSAFELFAKFGIVRTSVEEICREAKVSKATFYKYFKNKNALLLDILTELFDEGFDEFDRVFGSALPVRKKVGWLLKYKRRTAAKFGMAFVTDLYQVEGEIREMMNRAIIRSEEKFTLFIEENQKTGVIRPDLKPEFVVFMVNKMVEMVQDNSAMQFFDDPSDLAHEVNAFLFYGVLGRADEQTDK